MDGSALRSDPDRERPCQIRSPYFAALIRELNALLENREHRLVVEIQESTRLRSPKLRVRNKI
jgi:hypothetical protein